MSFVEYNKFMILSLQQRHLSLFEEFIPRYENIESIINSYETAHEKIMVRIVDENELNHEDAIRKGFDSQGYTIRKICSDLSKIN